MRILIDFCLLALTNRVCSGKASSGITDGPTFAKSLTLAARLLRSQKMKDYLPYIIPAVLTAVFNYMFYLFLKRKVDNSIEKYKISYSGVFKEKIEIYKSLLVKVHDLRVRIGHYQITDDEKTKEALRGEFNDLIRTYLINKPFLSDYLIRLFEEVTKELQSIYEAFVFGSPKNGRPIEQVAAREKEYWHAVDKLRNGEMLNKIEEDIVFEIRRDLQTLSGSKPRC